MVKVWVYGFEPFKHYRRNITAELLADFPALPGVQIDVLPVRFEAELFLKPVRQLQPRYVLGLGQCPRGELLRIERRAFNRMRDKSTGLDAPIDPGGPATLNTAWRLQPGSRCRDSYDAGRYVCNFSMYVLGQQAAQQGFASAFLHLPRQFNLNQARREVLRQLTKVLKHV